MARTKAPLMVRGMGTGMRVLELLMEAVRERGGGEEIFEFMTRPRFERNLDAIADTIVDCDWRIPISEVQSLSLACCTREQWAAGRTVEEMKNLFWREALDHFGIPYHCFERDGRIQSKIPGHYFTQLHGRTMDFPLLLNREHSEENEKVLVVGLDMAVRCHPGETIDARDVNRLTIVEARYFNLDA